MRTHFHAALAVLAAILTAVAVIAVKRGTEWALTGASAKTLNVVLVLIVVLICAGASWSYLLRPWLVERRKQR